MKLFLKVPGRGIAQLTEKEREVAEELWKENAFTKSLEYVGEKVKNDLSNCKEKLKHLCDEELKHLCDYYSLNAFDVLAHLCSSPQGEPWGDPEGLVYWLDNELGLFSKLSPEFRALL